MLWPSSIRLSELVRHGAENWRLAMSLKTVAWLVDDETPHARVTLGEGWPGGSYAESLVRMTDAQNAIHTAVAADRERCAARCREVGEVAAEMYGDGAECLTTAAMCAEACVASAVCKHGGGQCGVGGYCEPCPNAGPNDHNSARTT